MGGGGGGTTAATVNVDVTNLNDAPDAIDDAATVDEDATGNPIDVLANDTDRDGDQLMITTVADPAQGTAAIDDAGTPGDPSDDVITYTPDAGFTGTDAFTYDISDGNGGSDTATVSVTVTNVNDAPDAVDDAATVEEDSTGNEIPVLTNDTDTEGDELTITAVGDPANGTAFIDTNATPGDPTDDFVRYSPQPNFAGADAFTYEISDGSGGTDTATVNVDVTNLNDAPDAIDDAAPVDEDSTGNPIDRPE